MDANIATRSMMMKDAALKDGEVTTQMVKRHMMMNMPEHMEGPNEQDMMEKRVEAEAEAANME
jgi:hypothetical protein